MVDIDDTNKILGTYESHAQSLLNEMIPFRLAIIFHSLTFCSQSGEGS